MQDSALPRPESGNQVLQLSLALVQHQVEAPDRSDVWDRGIDPVRLPNLKGVPKNQDLQPSKHMMT